MKLVDLSQPFYPGMYRTRDFEKHPELDVEIKTVQTVKEAGTNMLRISFGNHMGTHLDSPMHVVSGGVSIDQLPLETFYGTSVVLSIPKGPDEGISRVELISAQPAVKKGDIVLLHTGWGTKFTSPDYPSHHPYLTPEGATWLVEKGVRMVGIDVSSVDLPHSMRKEGFKHTTLRILLENQTPVIHNLTNLESISSRRVMVFALPIKFRDVDGSPARVVAQVD